MGFLTPLYPIVMDRFALSLAQVGTVSMTAALASALAQPLFGVLFDRVGASAFLYLAPLATGVFTSLLPAAPSFPLFLTFLFLGCLGSAAFHPKGASVTPGLSGAHPEMGMAVFSAGGNLGYAAGPALVAFFLASFGAAASPLLIVPSAAVAACLALFLPLRQIAERTARTARLSFRELLERRDRLIAVARVVFLNFLLTVGVRGMQTFLPVYCTRLGVPVTGVGVLFTVMLAAGALASLLASSLSRRYGWRPLVIVSLCGGPPLFLAAIPLLPHPVGLVLITAAGILLTCTNPIIILLGQRHAGDSPAMASSLLMGLSWGLAGLVMIPLGVLGERIGIRSMLILIAAAPLAAMGPALRIPRG